jgi:hypothetical protein
MIVPDRRKSFVQKWRSEQVLFGKEVTAPYSMNLSSKLKKILVPESFYELNLFNNFTSVIHSKT